MKQSTLERYVDLKAKSVLLMQECGWPEQFITNCIEIDEQEIQYLCHKTGFEPWTYRNMYVNILIQNPTLKFTVRTWKNG